MKLYKDNENNVFAYELDGSQDDLIGNKTPIAQEEAEQIRQSKYIEQFNKLSYSAKRAAEYPPITDFVDAYYWMQKGRTDLMDAYVAKCEATKLKYPK